MVKSSRNMTLDPFLDLLPSMVAFIYIDRARNEATFAISDKFDVDGQVLSEAVELAYTSLSSGNLSSKWTVAERSLSFRYFMWFEDLAGRPLVPHVDDFTLSHYPSIVGNDFVQNLICKIFTSDQLERDQAVACYELLYVQTNCDVTETSTDLVLEAKRFAAKLWEVTSSSARVLDGVGTFM